MEKIKLYIGGHNKKLLEETINILKNYNFDVIKVDCDVNKIGWIGCTKCHQKIAEKAKNNGDEWYVSLEQNVRPSDKFSYSTIIDAISLVKEKVTPLVNLSIFPVIGCPQTFRVKKINNSIWKKVRPFNDLTVAIVVNTNFMLESTKKSLQKMKAIDTVIEPAARYIAYPVPFRRNSEKSTATPIYNKGLLKFIRKLTFHHKMYSIIELIIQYQILIIVIIIIAIYLINKKF